MEEALQDLIDQAAAAVSYAQDVREIHRRRTKRGNPQREADIEIALKRLRTRMSPIITALRRIPFERPSAARDEKHEALLEISKALQRERRKLWKMQQRKET